MLPVGVGWAFSQRAGAKSDISQSRDRQELHRLDPHSVRGHTVSPPLSDSQGGSHECCPDSGKGQGHTLLTGSGKCLEEPIELEISWPFWRNPPQTSQT